ncbi:MAG: hypothetical protein J5658_03710 [Prevotella sp.]|nr:hypothetical protein [Prevotella sp.]
MNKIITWLLVAIVLFLAGLITGNLTAKREPETIVKVQIDTLYRYDTIRVETPKIIEKRVVDTMTVEVVDYKVVHDTAFVNLPREEVEYRDTSYRAVVSGFNPRLEELEIYQKERIVTIQTERVIKPSPWALSVSAGYGVSTKGLTPYIGVGVSYNLYTFNRRKPPL